MKVFSFCIVLTALFAGSLAAAPDEPQTQENCQEYCELTNQGVFQCFEVCM